MSSDDEDQVPKRRRRPYDPSQPVTKRFDHYYEEYTNEYTDIAEENEAEKILQRYAEISKNPDKVQAAKQWNQAQSVYYRRKEELFGVREEGESKTLLFDSSDEEAPEGGPDSSVILNGGKKIAITSKITDFMLPPESHLNKRKQVTIDTSPPKKIIPMTFDEEFDKWLITASEDDIKKSPRIMVTDDLVSLADPFKLALSRNVGYSIKDTITDITKKDATFSLQAHRCKSIIPNSTTHVLANMKFRITLLEVKQSLFAYWIRAAVFEPAQD